MITLLNALHMSTQYNQTFLLHSNLIKCSWMNMESITFWYFFYRVILCKDQLLVYSWIPCLLRAALFIHYHMLSPKFYYFSLSMGFSYLVSFSLIVQYRIYEDSSSLSLAMCKTFTHLDPYKPLKTLRLYAYNLRI